MIRWSWGYHDRPDTICWIPDRSGAVPATAPNAPIGPPHSISPPLPPLSVTPGDGLPPAGVGLIRKRPPASRLRGDGLAGSGLRPDLSLDPPGRNKQRGGEAVSDHAARARARRTTPLRAKRVARSTARPGRSSGQGRPGRWLVTARRIRSLRRPGRAATPPMQAHVSLHPSGWPDHRTTGKPLCGRLGYCRSSHVRHAQGLPRGLVRPL